MKTLVFICTLLNALNGFAQNKNYLKTHAGNNTIEYIRSAKVTTQSDAVVVQGDLSLIHTKQFLPLDTKGDIYGRGDLNKQVDQLFRNISSALKSAKANRRQIIKLNIFVKDLDRIDDVQYLVSRKFSRERKPSISFVAGNLAHPDALISIDAIAVSRSTENRVKLFGSPEDIQAALLPSGPVVYVSGQAAKGGLAEATQGTLLQLNETLKSLGIGKKDIVQIKSFLSPMSSLSIVQNEFFKFFEGNAIPPLIFADWISSDPVIEIELIASSSAVGGNEAPQIEYITPPGMSPSPVYSKVVRLNYGKKAYISGRYGSKMSNADDEVRAVFDSMKDVLSAIGSDLNHLLKATYYIDNDVYSKSLADLRLKYYDASRPPAASKAMVKGIGIKRAGISIDMIGSIPE